MPWVLAGLGILGALHHVFFYLYYGGFSYDQLLQLAGAWGLLRGKGLAYAGVDPRYPYAVAYPSIAGWWPPCYSRLVAVLLGAVPDVVRVTTWIDVAAAILFLAACGCLLRAARLHLGVLGGGLLLAWWAAVSSPLRLLSSAEVLALALFCAALAAAVLALREGSHALPAAVAAGLFAGAAGATRYAYWPLAAVVPACLMCLGWSSRKRLLRAAALGLGAAGVIFLAAWSQHRENGYWMSPIVDQAGRPGFYPANLLRMSPFPADLMGLRRPVSAVLEWAAGSSADHWLPWALWLVSICLLAVCLREAVRVLRRSPADDVEGRFLCLAAAGTAFVTVGVLMWLALRHQAHPGGFAFVNEPRYYAPAFLFFHLTAASVLARRVRASGRARPPLLAALGLLFVGCALPWMRLGEWAFLSENLYRQGNKVFASVLRDRASLLSPAGRPVVYVDGDMSRLLAADAVGALALNTRDWKDELYRLASYHGPVIVYCGYPCQDPAVVPLRDTLLRLGATRFAMPKYELWEWRGAAARP